MAPVFLLLGFLTALQDVREDRELWSDEIWGQGVLAGPEGGKGPEAPPPLEITNWLVLPEDAPLTEWQIFMRHVLDPDAPQARVGEGRWVEREGRVVEHARAAVALVRAERDEVRMADLDGAELLFVEGEGFLGDPERRGYRGVPIALRAGENRLLVLAARGPFDLELWKPMTRIVLATWDVVWPPSVESGEFWISVPAMNASTEAVQHLCYHWGYAVAVGGEHRPRVNKWTCGGGIFPLGMLLRESPFYDHIWGKSAGIGPDRDALYPIIAFADGHSLPARVLLRGPGTSITGGAGLAVRRDLREGSPYSRLGERVMLVADEDQDAPVQPGTTARRRLDLACLWYEGRRAPHGGLRNMLPLEHDALLYGNEDTHPTWRVLVDRDVPVRVVRGRLETPDGLFERDDLAGWFLVPRADRRGSGLQTLCIADTGERGARLGQWLRSLTAPAPEPDLDWAFWAPGPDGPELVTSGRFPR